MTTQELNKELGNIDIYLLDQILKGRYNRDTKILDAGCGEGRNLIYFLNNHYQVFGVDQNPDAIRMLHFILGSTYPYISKEDFKVGSVETMDFENNCFDLVISSAVLHFAKGYDHFRLMFSEMIRVLKPKGQLFIRMTSNIGLKGGKKEGNDGCYSLPDGSLRYLITRESISELVTEFDLLFIESVKTTIVDDLRSMSTLVLGKK